MGEFDGKTVLITGGGSGIGLATARSLLGEGASVVLAGRSGERLEAARRELDGAERVLCVPTDVSRSHDLDQLMAAVRSRFGSLDGVFANAGVAVFARSDDVTEADFDQVMGTNLFGVYFTVTKAARLLSPGGAVVLNGSWLVHRGLAFTSLYAASKAAVVNLSRTLAADLGERGIRVNAVSPGYIVTEMFNRITTTEQQREQARAQVSLGRLGEPGDIAAAVAFLLSPRAGYLTGQEIVVDGGVISCVPA